MRYVYHGLKYFVDRKNQFIVKRIFGIPGTIKHVVRALPKWKNVEEFC